MTDIEMMEQYYDLMGNKFLSVLKKVNDKVYCVKITDAYGRKVSTLVEICWGSKEEYAVERDYCQPGQEENMIAEYEANKDEYYREISLEALMDEKGGEL